MGREGAYLARGEETPLRSGFGDEDLSLVGRCAFVSGSGRNIGRAIAEELAYRGANIIVNVRSNTAEGHGVASYIARKYGVGCVLVVGDLSRRDVVCEVREIGEREFGRVDISVSNAARRLYRTFEEMDDADWHRHLNMQLTASWYLAKELIPSMQRAGWGRIIHINGPDGWYGGVHRIPHSVGKGGLRTLTKGLAREVGKDGVTVNDVVPGFVDTRRDPGTHPQINAEYTRNALAQIAIGRQVGVREVAWACAWLCAERSGGITGAAIHVDGGERMLG